MLKHDADGFEWDDLEPPFTETEMERARQLRRVAPDPRYTRRTDHCPHTPACADVTVCLRNIAWYLRYQRDIETTLAQS